MPIWLLCHCPYPPTLGRVTLLYVPELSTCRAQMVTVSPLTACPAPHAAQDQLCSEMSPAGQLWRRLGCWEELRDVPPRVGWQGRGLEMRTEDPVAMHHRWEAEVPPPGLGAFRGGGWPELGAPHGAEGHNVLMAGTLGPQCGTSSTEPTTTGTSDAIGVGWGETPRSPHLQQLPDIVSATVWRSP